MKPVARIKTQVTRNCTRYHVDAYRSRSRDGVCKCVNEFTADTEIAK